MSHPGLDKESNRVAAASRDKSTGWSSNGRKRKKRSQRRKDLKGRFFFLLPQPSQSGKRDVEARELSDWLKLAPSHFTRRSRDRNTRLYLD